MKLTKLGKFKKNNANQKQKIKEELAKTLDLVGNDRLCQSHFGREVYMAWTLSILPFQENEDSVQTHPPLILYDFLAQQFDSF